LIQKLYLVVRAQGQVTWAKMGWNLYHLWCHLQKTWNPKPRIVFIANWKICCIF